MQTVHPASLPSGHTYAALRRCQAQYERQSPARWCRHASLRSSAALRVLHLPLFKGLLSRRDGTLPWPCNLGEVLLCVSCEGHVGWGDQHTEALTRRHLLFDSRAFCLSASRQPCEEYHRCPATKTQSLRSREGNETSPTEDGKLGGRTEAQGRRIPV